MISRSDKVKKIEKGIRSIVESEGYYCPKFFISSKDDVLMFHVHVYEENHEAQWANELRRLYPDVADKVLGRWVTIGETAFEILGIDASSSADHIRAKDKHGNEWLIPISGLLSGIK